MCVYVYNTCTVLAKNVIYYFSDTIWSTSVVCCSKGRT